MQTEKERAANPGGMIRKKKNVTHLTAMKGRGSLQERMQNELFV